MVIGGIDFQRIEHGRIPDQGRIAAQDRREYDVLFKEVLAEDDLCHRDGIFGTLAGGGGPHKGLVRVFERTVDDMEVAFGHGYIDRLAGDTAGEVHRGSQIGQSMEVLQVIEGAIASLIVEIEHEGGAVSGHESHRTPPDRDIALGVAGRKNEALGGQGDEFHQQISIDAHPIAFDIGASLPPIFQGFRISKIDADFFQDAHRCIVQTLDLFLVQGFVEGQGDFQRGQHRHRSIEPGPAAGGATTFFGAVGAFASAHR